MTHKYNLFNCTKFTTTTQLHRLINILHNYIVIEVSIKGQVLAYTLSRTDHCVVETQVANFAMVCLCHFCFHQELVLDLFIGEAPEQYDNHIHIRIIISIVIYVV